MAESIAKRGKKKISRAPVSSVRKRMREMGRGFAVANKLKLMRLALLTGMRASRTSLGHYTSGL